MKIDILTLFPEMFRGPLHLSLLKRAKEKGIVNIRVFDIRYFSKGSSHLTDDYPYGGGSGMVMKPEPIFEALKAASGKSQAKLRDKNKKSPWIIFLTPQGEKFNQKKAQALAQKDHLIFICGRYKGIDERIRKYLVNEEISIGDYVLSGGEAAAWVVIESVVRLIPGVVGDKESVETDSFYKEEVFDYPYYTRPGEYLGWRVPKILVSGDHKKIQIWRRKMALEKTWRNRPELLARLNLSKEDALLVKKIKGKYHG